MNPSSSLYKFEPQQDLSQADKMQKDQELMNKYYNEIYNKLSEIIQTNPGNGYIDPYSLISILQDRNAIIPREKMSLFFKHLLAYTYTAKASEIEHYQTVNKHLQQIEFQLKELLDKDKKPVEPTVAPAAAVSST